jgi:hypothetical protein
MFSPRVRIAALAVTAWAFALTAHAQGTAGTGGSTTAGGIRSILLSIGSETVNALGTIYLSQPACLADAPLKFRFDGAPSDRPSIDIYVGERCNGTDRKSSTTNSCSYLTSLSSGGITQGLIITVKATDIIKDCSKQTEEMPKLWFLWVNTPDSTEDVGAHYAMFDRLSIDTRPPGAPSSLTSGEGESVIPVSWKSGETHLKGFVVFIDTSEMAAPPLDAGSGSAGSTGALDAAVDDGGLPDAAAGAATADAGTFRVSLIDAGSDTTVGSTAGACGPTLLTSGERPDQVPSGVRMKQVNQPTATGVDLVPADFQGAKRATIAVAAIDLAGNQGPLSNLACVKIVNTTGFLDRYRANGGSAKAGCPCSAMGPVQIESAWPVALATSILALGSRRRRRS